MAFSPEQIDRIKYLSDEQWFDEDDEAGSQERYKYAFALISSPDELHEYVRRVRLDISLDIMQDVVRHPLCDLGTALWVYFLLRPWFFYRMEARGKSLRMDEQEAFSLAKEIEARALAMSFRSAELAFDPASANGHNFLEERGALDFLPQAMTAPVAGRVPERIADTGE